MKIAVPWSMFAPRQFTYEYHSFGSFDEDTPILLVIAGPRQCNLMHLPLFAVILDSTLARISRRQPERSSHSAFTKLGRLEDHAMARNTLARLPKNPSAPQSTRPRL